MGERKTRTQYFKRWFERYSHVDTFWGAISEGGLIRTFFEWSSNLWSSKILVSIFVSAALAVWSWVEHLPAPIIALITLCAFAISVWSINGVIWSYGRFLRRKLPKNTNPKINPAPQEIDPKQTVFRNLKIRLPDLVGETNTISDKVFVDCDIFGPGVVALGGQGLGACEFNGVSIGGNPDMTFIATNQTMVAGVMALDNVKVIGGTFRNLSFIGPKGAVEAVKKQLPTK